MNKEKEINNMPEEKIDITKQLVAFNIIMDALKDLTIEEKIRVINSVSVLCEIKRKNSYHE